MHLSWWCSNLQLHSYGNTWGSYNLARNSIWLSTWWQQQFLWQVQDRILSQYTVHSISFVSVGVVVTAGPLPPPNNVHVSVANFVSGELTFTWSSVLPHCSSISYNISASNCGNCPTNTTKTTVTCTDAPTWSNDTLCTFAVQTILCGTIVGNSSEQVTVTIIRTPRKSICFPNLTCLYLMLNLLHNNITNSFSFNRHSWRNYAVYGCITHTRLSYVQACKKTNYALTVSIIATIYAQ